MIYQGIFYYFLFVILNLQINFVKSMIANKQIHNLLIQTQHIQDTLEDLSNDLEPICQVLDKLHLLFQQCKQDKAISSFKKQNYSVVLGPIFPKEQITSIVQNLISLRAEKTKSINLQKIGFNEVKGINEESSHIRARKNDNSPNQKSKKNQPTQEAKNHKGISLKERKETLEQQNIRYFEKEQNRNYNSKQVQKDKDKWNDHQKIKRQFQNFKFCITENCQNKIMREGHQIIQFSKTGILQYFRNCQQQQDVYLTYKKIHQAIILPSISKLNKKYEQFNKENLKYIQQFAIFKELWLKMLSRQFLVNQNIKNNEILQIVVQSKKNIQMQREKYALQQKLGHLNKLKIQDQLSQSLQIIMEIIKNGSSNQAINLKPNMKQQNQEQYLKFLGKQKLFENLDKVIKEVQKQQDYKSCWDIYVRDQMDWLTAHYKKIKILNYAKKILEIEELFRLLKGKIQESKFNKDDDYFKKFAKMQKEKYLQRNIEPSLLQHSQTTYQFHRQYTKMLRENHMEFIEFLTEQRYSFQNIARHIIRQKNLQQMSFEFIVEEGIGFGNKKGFYLINSRLLLYVFVRDIANAIDQLQQQGIFHVDIAMRNIILFNCSILQLRDYEKLRKIGDKIKFKLIDFGFAFFLKGKDKRKLTQKIIQKRLSKQCNIEDDPFPLFIKQKKQDIKRILNKQQYYKQLHSAAFLGLINVIINNNFQVGDTNENSDSSSISKQQQSYIEALINKKDYKNMVVGMNTLINKQMKN